MDTSVHSRWCRRQWRHCRLVGRLERERRVFSCVTSSSSSCTRERTTFLAAFTVSRSWVASAQPQSRSSLAIFVSTIVLFVLGAATSLPTRINVLSQLLLPGHLTENQRMTVMKCENANSVAAALAACASNNVCLQTHVDNDASLTTCETHENLANVWDHNSSRTATLADHVLKMLCPFTMRGRF